MPVGDFTPKELDQARADLEAKYEEFSNRTASEDEVRSIIRYLRGVPAEDRRKKDELSKYLNSERGSGFSKQERKKFYDELLGENRNRRTIG